MLEALWDLKFRNQNQGNPEVCDVPETVWRRKAELSMERVSSQVQINEDCSASGRVLSSPPAPLGGSEMYKTMEQTLSLSAWPGALNIAKTPASPWPTLDGVLQGRILDKPVRQLPYSWQRFCSSAQTSSHQIASSLLSKGTQDTNRIMADIVFVYFEGPKLFSRFCRMISTNPGVPNESYCINSKSP